MSEVNRYIVRKRMTGDDNLFGQKPSPGVRSVTVRAADAQEALRLGAAQMNRSAHELEVVKMEDSGTIIPVNPTITPDMIEEAWKKRGDQDTRYVGPM